MIFRPELARAVVRGKKTATRRLVKGDEDRCRYRVGRDYAVCPGRGREAIGRLRVTDVRSELLGVMSQRDAIREGFRTRADFADYWMRLHYPSYMRRHPDGPADEVLELWQDRYGDRLVWVIEFTVDTTQHPRMLRGRMGSISDYTENAHQAASGEPEAVSAVEQAAITKAAQARDQVLRADSTVQERQVIEQAISRLELLAPSPAVASRLRTMRKQLRAIDQILKAA